MAAGFQSAVYALCFITSAACGLLLARNFIRTSVRLLLWSSLCFGLLAANNLTVIVDLLVLPESDLQIPRLAFSLSAVLILLFGFIWDLEN
jgi:hypothetical protein